jgi:hypothetical protein
MFGTFRHFLILYLLCNQVMNNMYELIGHKRKVKKPSEDRFQSSKLNSHHRKEHSRKTIRKKICKSAVLAMPFKPIRTNF